ncbi:RNA-splicing factor [Dipsacomyces acuminosporus]|nr:RNA-splicing factor [Dipsacomyces acuminosporus]
MAETDSLFKKSKRRGGARNIRKRPIDAVEADGEAQVERVVLQPNSAKSSRAQRLKQQTDNDSSGGSPDTASDNGEGSVVYHYKKAMDATRTAEYEAHGAVHGGQGADSAGDAAKPNEPGIYKGLKGYGSRLKEGSGSKKTGPVKAPANVRSTSVFDYQPNVCKDYKETGYCGYGDSCIFLHDRGNHKTGWQLEKEFEEAQQGVQRDNPKLWDVDLSDDEQAADGKHKPDSSLPFACLICRKPFVKPVVTKCRHYFCEECALAHYRKTPKCFACGAATAGAFKRAKNLEA